MEDVAPDDDVLQACRVLKEKGYRIALDDVCSFSAVEPYLGLAYILKVDFRQPKESQQQALAREIRHGGLLPLAEKEASPGPGNALRVLPGLLL